MKTRPWMSTALACGVLMTMACGMRGQAQALAQHKTENVIVVMLDGMRWQEVFRGADPELIKTLGPEALGDPKERAALAEKRYWRDTPEERRAALMPFLWETVAKQGQLFGNRDLGSDSHVANPLHFSYPGYSETLTGLVDPRINSNDNVPNPNVTVFEWLNKKPEFAGKVAAFGAWEVFDGIFNKQRCGFEVNASYAPLTDIPETPELKLLNALKAETVRIWPDEAFDPMPFHTAVEYIKAKKPRVIFLGLGETDDWAHADSYAEYLNAAHLGDSYLEQLWTMVQAMPEYAGKTTLIVLPDHGRGVGAKWTDHGEDIPESAQTWMAFIGPDTPALGERKNSTPVTESEIAATVAALLGEDYHGAVPATGAPIADVLGTK
ncbi:MAG TPA: hypothetical protein VG893_02945 [Terracidiphilus sp.]|nr:hypothetical protein [Terracidiphilus sp.]